MPSAERYARQLILPGFGPDAQGALENARVLVIGAGGLGSAVIPALAAAGVGTIGIVDDDIVELSNLPRQLVHGTDDLGAAKTASAAERVAQLDPEIAVKQYPIRFTSETALQIARGFDLLIDGSDNFPTRYLANDVAVLLGIPLVWGAVSQFGGQAGVAWAEHGPHYRDLFPTPPPPGTVPSCAEGGVFPSTVAVVGSIMTAEALKVLTGVGRPLIGRVTLYDALGGEFRDLAYERDPDGEPITGLIDYEAFCAAPGSGRQSDAVSDAAALPPALTATELAGELDRVQLVDVREPWEAGIASIGNSRLIPLGSLPDAADTLDPDAAIVVYCHHGIRSQSALELLTERGFRNVRHLEGGIDAWAREVAPEMARY
jgi:adenylyltransferase/sulfurtransferase